MRRNSPTTHAFTIVELLVVITIIVVLLALLAPAMDRAVYQAELAVCGANVRAIATGVQVYAADSQRAYPYRERIRKKTSWPTHLNDNNFDDRPRLSEIFDLNGTLNCPLAGEANLEDETADEIGRPVWSQAAYDLWFDFRYTGIEGLRGMYRIGDRFEWESQSNLGNRINRFNILASDRDMATPNGLNAITSHPDKDPAVMPQRINDGQAEEGTSGITSAGTRFAYASWDVRGQRRGNIERNFSYTDGSVLRITDITLDDPRMVDAPYRNTDGSSSAWFIQLPTE